MATEDTPGVEEVDLVKLSVPQLTQLHQQVDEELSVFQSSLQSLKMAQRRYVESKGSLEKLTPQSDGKTMMVPLSGCLYVPGKIADVNSVLIDIGTGYYVEKDLDGATDYFKRRVAFITEQIEKIQALGLEKSRIRDVIAELRDMKIQAAMEERKQAASKS